MPPLRVRIERPVRTLRSDQQHGLTEKASTFHSATGLNMGWTTFGHFASDVPYAMPVTASASRGRPLPVGTPTLKFTSPASRLAALLPMCDAVLIFSRLIKKARRQTVSAASRAGFLLSLVAILAGRFTIMTRVTTIAAADRCPFTEEHIAAPDCLKCVPELTSGYVTPSPAEPEAP